MYSSVSGTFMNWFTQPEAQKSYIRLFSLVKDVLIESTSAISNGIPCFRLKSRVIRLPESSNQLIYNCPKVLYSTCKYSSKREASGCEVEKFDVT